MFISYFVRIFFRRKIGLALIGHTPDTSRWAPKLVKLNFMRYDGLIYFNIYRFCFNFCMGLLQETVRVLEQRDDLSALVGQLQQKLMVTLWEDDRQLHLEMATQEVRVLRSIFQIKIKGSDALSAVF